MGTHYGGSTAGTPVSWQLTTRSQHHPPNSSTQLPTSNFQRCGDGWRFGQEVGRNGCLWLNLEGQMLKRPNGEAGRWGENLAAGSYWLEGKTGRISIQKWVKERKKREKLGTGLQLKSWKWRGKSERERGAESTAVNREREKTVLFQFGEILTCLLQSSTCSGCRNTLVHQKRLRWLWSTLEERRPAGVESVEAEENQKKCWSGMGCRMWASF